MIPDATAGQPAGHGYKPHSANRAARLQVNKPSATSPGSKRLWATTVFQAFLVRIPYCSVSIKAENKLFQFITDFSKGFQHVFVAALHRSRVGKPLMHAFPRAGEHWQFCAAWSQRVIMQSNSFAGRSSTCLDFCREISTPVSRMATIACGCTPLGSTPAGEDLKFIAAEMAHQPFRHLAAGGISGAEEENFLFHATSSKHSVLVL